MHLQCILARLFGRVAGFPLITVVLLQPESEIMTITDQSLGQLARSIPGATAIFHKHQLDFCCGGKKSLRDAASDRDLNLEALTDELEVLQSQQPAEQEWANVPDIELIEHILTRYHDVHRQQLPELIRLAQRVELVHGGHTECPAGLSQHLETMLQELESHMKKEEQILFPMISRGITGMAVQPIAMMRSEHDDHGDHGHDDGDRRDERQHPSTSRSGRCRAIGGGIGVHRRRSPVVVPGSTSMVVAPLRRRQGTTSPLDPPAAKTRAVRSALSRGGRDVRSR